MEERGETEKDVQEWELGGWGDGESKSSILTTGLKEAPLTSAWFWHYIIVFSLGPGLWLIKRVWPTSTQGSSDTIIFVVVAIGRAGTDACSSGAGELVDTGYPTLGVCLQKRNDSTGEHQLTSGRTGNKLGYCFNHMYCCDRVSSHQ